MDYRRGATVPIRQAMTEREDQDPGHRMADRDPFAARVAFWLGALQPVILLVHWALHTFAERSTQTLQWMLLGVLTANFCAILAIWRRQKNDERDAHQLG
jgi:hypothetical protein